MSARRHAAVAAAKNSGNAQGNRAALATTGTAAGPVWQHGGTGQLQAPRAGRREATIDPRAYRDVSGVMQLNRAAGSGNASLSVFVLRPPASATFREARRRP